MKWISVKREKPPVGLDVETKTRAGVRRMACWVDDTFEGSRMAGWMINLAGDFTKNTGEPTHWRKIKAK